MLKDVEYIICESIMLDEGLSYNDYSRINNMTYEEANKIFFKEGRRMKE